MSDQEFIVKSEDTTDYRYGYVPEKRPITHYLDYGVINLDKPIGPTSHEVVAWVKRILKLDRAAHGGTLDPKVSGVLPIALGRATRVIKFIMGAKKEYVCVMALHGEVSRSSLTNVINEFVGLIYQRPPLRSSVKRTVRTRRVYYIDLLEVANRHVLMLIGCEAGTYIRKLCHDIGEVLGCGAHMKELRRTKAGPFTEESSITLHDLADAYSYWVESGDESMLRKVVIPMERALEFMYKVYVRDSAVDAICHGADLAAPGVIKVSPKISKGDIVAMMTLKGELIALGKALASGGDMVKVDKGIVVNTERVVMRPGTYPKQWGK